jgi:hypothetical protein
VSGSVEAEVSAAMALDRNLHDLYRGWWVGDPSGQATATDSAARRSPAAPSRHEVASWELIQRHGDGSVVVARGGELAVVAAGDWLAGAEGVVDVCRRSAWDDGQFAWRTSERAQPPASARWRARIYVPGRRESEPGLGRVADALDRAGLWFEAKSWLGPPGRRDQTVVWVSARDGVRAVSALAESEGGDERLAPPPLTLRCGPLGVAHDPLGSDSLGQLICGAVISAGDLDPARDLRDRWQAACRLHRLCPDRPWRHPGSIDPFGFWAEAEARAARDAF